MAYLKNILEDYEEILKGESVKHITLWKQIDRNIREGDVFEIHDSVPIVLAVFSTDEEFSDVVPLSFQWELATENDLIIKFDHVLRDRWIAELDLSITVPNWVLYQSEYVGRLSLNDIELINRILKGKKYLPRNRTGVGYDDEIHKRFKRIERERHKWLFEELLVSVGGSVGILPQVRVFFEGYASERLAAAGKNNVFEKYFGAVIFNPEDAAVRVFFEDSFLGKPGKVFFRVKGGEVVIYRGIIKDFEIRNISETVFRVFSEMEVGVE